MERLMYRPDDITTALKEIHPYVPSQAVNVSKQLLAGIAPICEDIDNYGGKIFIQGSDGKRLIGGTPNSWHLPGKVWAAWALGDSTMRKDKVAQRIIHGGKNDTDWRFVLDENHDWFDVWDVADEIKKTGEVDFKMTNFGVTPLAQVKVGEFHIDLGLLPNGHRWEMQNQTNCRGSVNAMPFRETYTGVFIKADGSLVYPKENYELLFSPSHGLIRGYADLPQCLIGAIRDLQTSYWWPEKSPTSTWGGRPVNNMYEDLETWLQAKELTLQKRQELLVNRADEIIASLLLLLTCDPKQIQDLEKRYIASICGIQSAVNTVYHARPMSEIDLSDQAHIEQSSPFQLMKVIGAKSFSELHAILKQKLLSNLR